MYLLEKSIVFTEIKYYSSPEKQIPVYRFCQKDLDFKLTDISIAVHFTLYIQRLPEKQQKFTSEIYGLLCMIVLGQILYLLEPSKAKENLAKNPIP